MLTVLLEDFEIIKDVYEEEKTLAIIQILSIGFANGVKYERENCKRNQES